MKKNKPKRPSKRALPIWGWAAITIALLIFIGAGVLLTQSTKPSTVSLPAEISVSQASQKRDSGAYILDVREPSEWSSFHIPGAVLIPLGDLPSRLNEVPKDREVVVVCRTGNRSATGRDILKNAGFTKVTSMAGGVTEWRSKGLPIATGQ